MRSILLELLKEPTDRDRQVNAGPSSLATPCNSCVARALRNEPEKPSPYWLKAVIGTATHKLAESRLDSSVSEIKLHIGHLEGYGDIRGTVDYFKDGDLRDWKGTDRKKRPGLIKAYDHPAPEEGEANTTRASRFKLKGYIGQMHLYGRALEALGHKVDTVTLEFFCRDGVGDDDIFVFQYDYDPEYAEAIWARVVYIWENLYTQEWEIDPDCFPCTVLS